MKRWWTAAPVGAAVLSLAITNLTVTRTAVFRTKQLGFVLFFPLGFQFFSNILDLCHPDHIPRVNLIQGVLGHFQLGTKGDIHYLVLGPRLIKT